MLGDLYKRQPIFHAPFFLRIHRETSVSCIQMFSMRELTTPADQSNAALIREQFDRDALPRDPVLVQSLLEEARRDPELVKRLVTQAKDARGRGLRRGQLDQ